MRHTPPLYTNNKLTPVDGSTIPEDHLRKYCISPISLGTDPNLTLKTRRSTGYYKAPSLKGVWYRGMFGHSGWRATLEDWFDPHRTRDGYVPTGYKPYDVKTYAVKVHLTNAPRREAGTTPVRRRSVNDFFDILRSGDWH